MDRTGLARSAHTPMSSPIGKHDSSPNYLPCATLRFIWCVCRYYAALDGAGLRVDRLQRPELLKGSHSTHYHTFYCTHVALHSLRMVGTVDYILPAALFEQTVSTATTSAAATPASPPKTPCPAQRLVFALDVSPESVARGCALASIRALHSVVRRLHHNYSQNQQQLRQRRHLRQQQLQHQQQYMRAPMSSSGGLEQASEAVDEESAGDTQVGIVAFHSHLHFFSVDQLATCAEHVRWHLCPADDPFCPLPPDQWLLSSGKDFERLNVLLDALPLLLPALTASCAPHR